MKKTLITLAALAMAAVAQATDLDFTNLSGESTITFQQPVWNNSTGDWTNSPSNTLTLAGVTTFDAANKTISNGTATVTYTNDVNDLFRVHNGSSDAFGGPYYMALATINFGTTGSVLLDRSTGSGYNMGELQLTLTGTLETVVYTSDASKWSTSEIKTRTLFQDLNGGAMWNRELDANGSVKTLTFTDLDGNKMVRVDNGTTLTTADTGKFVISNPNASTVQVQYVVTYMPDSAGQIPEPTTATLSLLALAGLCARRRRK